ncbi:MAG: hypothetical protein FD153_230 [Rhodospirillaceae bacterium]|nr:MAG: hypothetical protein FD153_230 [Rhodospirillaceae bacterium]
METRWGNYAYAQMRDLLGDGDCSGDAGRTALESLVVRLATAAGIPSSVLHLYVLKGSAINAFMLPDGPYRGDGGADPGG